jgi:hypothetical protein
LPYALALFLIMTNEDGVMLPGVAPEAAPVGFDVTPDVTDVAERATELVAAGGGPAARRKDGPVATDSAKTRTREPACKMVFINELLIEKRAPRAPRHPPGVIPSTNRGTPD